MKEGKVSVAQIDAAVRRILEAKFKLGLFDDPYRYISEERNKTDIMNTQQLALSKEAAVKSMVLLKNANQVLPLDQFKKDRLHRATGERPAQPDRQLEWSR